MKKRLVLYFAIFLFQSVLWSCSSGVNDHKSEEISYEKLSDNFRTPPREYGINCWWWWLNGNVTKGAITKDLEAMKSKNFQGAMIFDAGGHNQRSNKDIPAGSLFGSDEWNKLFVFALDEAERLGLSIGFNIQSGWNLGGPRVTPEFAAKQLTYSELKISGNKNIEQKLEQPKTQKDFYKDIVVLAFPIKEENKTTEVISNLDLKLGYHELGGSAPDTRFLLTNQASFGRHSAQQSSYVVKSDEIVNLTANMDQQGNFSWKAPEGEWCIMRIGYTCTDAAVSTSSGNWQGNVLDYMSPKAFDFYWNDVVEPIFTAAGHHVGETLKYMETDSWECGGMNWTDNFADEFKSYRDYELLNYLPILGGFVIDDVNTSNAFLADFRKTIGDLVANNHYARFAEYAHKYNMGVQPESAGPHAGPMDGIKNYGFSDIVMSEFWAPSPHRPKPENRFFLKQASSAAHIYGKKIVGAESFTTIGPHWNDELWHDQKSSFDHEICAGLNRVYLHTFTCSPQEMGLPGQEYFAGTHINPQVTWWDYSDAFFHYMSRVQSVIQEGDFVADVLYYYGDHVPNVFPYKYSDPAGCMPGFDYDVTDETIFLQLKTENGKIKVPGGVEYRVLVLPDHKVLSLAVLEKVQDLVENGATVIGPKPEKMLSLQGGQEAQTIFEGIANKLWGETISDQGEKEYGQGTIAWGMSARDYLMSKDIYPDFDVLENNSVSDFDYIHYSIGEKEVYFVSNQTVKKQKVNCNFRISGKQPELWDALIGEIRNANSFSQDGNNTFVPLTFEPYGAIMVIFDKEIKKNQNGTANENYPDYEIVQQIRGDWDVKFDTNLGGPGTVTFAELSDWAENEDPLIKYYSGAADYFKNFDFDSESKNGEHFYLQLENVKDVGIAEVKINGINKGVVWTKPFRIDITKELKKGENELEIKVINSWYNHLAGDELEPDKEHFTKTNIVIHHDYRGQMVDSVELEPSGLLGPVTIQKSLP